MRVPEREARLHLLAGINDGYSGSVPITHSLFLFDLLASGRNKISDDDIIALLSKEVKSTGPQIGNRDVYYRKESASCSLTIFEGGHEMLVDFAANQIMRQSEHDAVANAP